MELQSLTPDMPALLMEMGVRYDPQRLADALAVRQVEIASRAVQVAAALGGCIANVAKVPSGPRAGAHVATEGTSAGHSITSPCIAIGYLW